MELSWRWTDKGAIAQLYSVDKLVSFRLNLSERPALEWVCSHCLKSLVTRNIERDDGEYLTLRDCGFPCCRARNVGPERSYVSLSEEDRHLVSFTSNRHNVVVPEEALYRFLPEWLTPFQLNDWEQVLAGQMISRLVVPRSRDLSASYAAFRKFWPAKSKEAYQKQFKRLSEDWQLKVSQWEPHTFL